MEQTSNLKLPLIDTNNAEDLKKTFIDYVKMISGVDDSSALQILDKAIQNLQTTKQDKLTAGENITITNNVISGVGGVKEEDVMDIIENNAEQTNTLDIGTSATFDATSDEQIPTSKAVSDLMAGAGGGSGGGSKLYEHTLKLKVGNGSAHDYFIVKVMNTISEVMNADSFINYMNSKRTTNKYSYLIEGYIDETLNKFIYYTWYNSTKKTYTDYIQKETINDDLTLTISRNQESFKWEVGDTYAKGQLQLVSDTVIEL